MIDDSDAMFVFTFGLTGVQACVRPCLFCISIIIIQMKKDLCFRKFTTYFKMPSKINTDSSNIPIFKFPLSFANSIEFVEDS